jgi:acetyl-CoA acetyltransferase
MVVRMGVSALSPEIMGLGPVPASRQALKNAVSRSTTST